ncbi:hypothetical protein AB0M48_29800 [Lentzea sp. NPDC051208]|uniref:hypothetical protein n=1 Tax=Lentzea sp. NPDC051208 TaxID=3154642 RepID=UPI00342D30C4
MIVVPGGVSAAALLGTFGADELGVGDTRGIDWIELIIQIALAVRDVSLVTGMYGRKKLERPSGPARQAITAPKVSSPAAPPSSHLTHDITRDRE